MSLSEKFAIGAVVSVLGKFVLAGLAIKIGNYGFTVGPIDSMTVAAILTPILGAVHLGTYVANKGAPPDDKAT